MEGMTTCADRSRKPIGAWTRLAQSAPSVIGAGVVIRPSRQPGLGLGLFAERRFDAGDTITVYDGVLVHKTAVRKPSNVADPRQTHYLAVKQSDLVVQGLMFPLLGRGGGSFANHRADSNAKLLLVSNSLYGADWHVYFGDDVNSPANASARIVVLVAKETIAVDDEIFIRYGRLTCARMGIGEQEASADLPTAEDSATVDTADRESDTEWDESSDFL